MTFVLNGKNVAYAVYAISNDDVEEKLGHEPYVSDASTVDAAVDEAIEAFGLEPGPHSLAVLRPSDGYLQFLKVIVPEPQPQVEVSLVGQVSFEQPTKRGLFSRS